jgi:hypothetical protein
MKKIGNVTLNHVLLALILLIAISLRLLGINAGLPMFTIIPDELTIVRGAMEVWESAVPEGLGWPGTFYMFVLSLSYLVYFLLGNASDVVAGLMGDWVGLLGTVDDFYVRYYTTPTAQYIIARVWSVLFGTGTILLVFLVALRLYGVAAGLVAAGLLAVLPVHVAYSRLAVPDITMTFFVTASFYYMSRILKNRRDSDYWLAGVMVGLAVSNKLNGGIALLTLVFGHLASSNHVWSSILRKSLDRRLMVATGIAMLTFYLATPYLVTAPAVILKELAFSIMGEGTREISFGTLRETLWDVFDGLGLVTLLGGGLAIGWSFSEGGRDGRPIKLILLTSLIYLLPFAMSPRRSEYYLLPILPMVCIMASYGFLNTWNQISSSFPRFAWMRFTLIAIVVPLLAFSATGTLSTAMGLYEVDAGALAKRWIEENIPAGTRIAVEDSRVPLIRNSVSIERTLARLKDDALIRNEKARRIAGLEEYPATVFSNVVVNDEKVIQRQYEFLLLATERHRLPLLSYDVITFTGGSYVLSITRPELYRIVENGDVDYIVSVHINDELGDLIMEWPGIYLYARRTE